MSNYSTPFPSLYSAYEHQSDYVPPQIKKPEKPNIKVSRSPLITQYPHTLDEYDRKQCFDRFELLQHRVKVPHPFKCPKTHTFSSKPLLDEDLKRYAEKVFTHNLSHLARKTKSLEKQQRYIDLKNKAAKLFAATKAVKPKSRNRFGFDKSIFDRIQKMAQKFNLTVKHSPIHRDAHLIDSFRSQNDSLLNINSPRQLSSKVHMSLVEKSDAQSALNQPKKTKLPSKGSVRFQQSVHPDQKDEPSFQQQPPEPALVSWPPLEPKQDLNHVTSTSPPEVQKGSATQDQMEESRKQECPDIQDEGRAPAQPQQPVDPQPTVYANPSESAKAEVEVTVTVTVTQQINKSRPSSKTPFSPQTSQRTIASQRGMQEQRKTSSVKDFSKVPKNEKKFKSYTNIANPPIQGLKIYQSELSKLKAQVPKQTTKQPPTLKQKGKAKSVEKRSLEERPDQKERRNSNTKMDQPVQISELKAPIQKTGKIKGASQLERASTPKADRKIQRRQKEFQNELQIEMSKSIVAPQDPEASQESFKVKVKEEVPLVEDVQGKQDQNQQHQNEQQDLAGGGMQLLSQSFFAISQLPDSQVTMKESQLSLTTSQVSQVSKYSRFVKRTPQA